MIAPTGINQVRTFVGLGNYLAMLQDQIFWETIGRTLYFTVVSVGLELVLGLAIAQLIHSHPWGWKFLRFSLIIPWAVPTIVNGAMWRWIYSADFGALNGILMQLGLIKHYIPWLTLPNMAMNLVILADIWHMMPFVALILQAALATLPEELDEAAAVDGANAFQRFWQIRLPLLRPAILVALDCPHGGCLPRIRYRLHHHQRRAGLQNGHDHLPDLPEHLFLWETGDRRSAVLPDLDRYDRDGRSSISVSCTGLRRRNNAFPKVLPQACCFSCSPYRSCSLSSCPSSGCSAPVSPPRWNCLAVPPHWIPQHPTFQNYLDIIFPNLAASSVPRTFAVALLNSIKIASCGDHDLPRGRQPGGLCAGAHPLQASTIPSRSASWGRA